MIKKLVSIAFFLILFFLTSSFADEFYCPNEDGIFDIRRDVYNPNNTCEQWDTDFWQQCDPHIYSNCLKNQLILRKKYFEGKCEKVAEKTHSENNQSCKVKYSSTSRQYISISCKNATREFRNKVKELYRKDDP